MPHICVITVHKSKERILAFLNKKTNDYNGLDWNDRGWPNINRVLLQYI